ELLHSLDDGALARLVPGDGLHEPPGIGGRPQQVDGLLPGIEVFGGHEHGVPALGTDPHGHMIVVNLLDEGEQMRAGLASADRHGRTHSLQYGTRLSYRTGAKFRYHRGETACRSHSRFISMIRAC